ncbi:UDP-N-acetylmuramate dehydrogenase [Pseudotabrizicola alkalilacus]|uniref:UDP-N-acetylenolpyruvoylglucosamine reductase n=1 Tax=Pseudotabrizicola alkalilacus TaxID=2305252 RepID=A0A411Z6T3_9RHOB|nr:UDP-N-acetylmuramate dehydrogenase [Pseudotabrizicola alkalilacus]RGP38769.1 UDP-N-acetylmuramate dehydrogenase [Pseudotabrizicola alkalilacus]
MDPLSETAIAELGRLCPDGVERGVDLSAVSQWRIGGRADLVLRPASTAEVSALTSWFAARGIRPVVIGLTSNLLFDDAGLRVPCIQIGARMAQISLEGARVRAQAGIWVPGLARRLMQAGLGGAEHICGIPGTLGGLICMNGGSQRKGIGSNLLEVESVTSDGVVHTRPAQEGGFGYRQSVYQANGEIITAATLHLPTRPRAEIRAEMRAILADRRRKFPRKEPNCGSVFVSDPALYAQHGPPGAIIESLGLKGRRIGDALVSPRHANFIVNAGAARSVDMLALIQEISQRSMTELGAPLRAEVRYVASDGTTCPATQAHKDALAETAP